MTIPKTRSAKALTLPRASLLSPALLAALVLFAGSAAAGVVFSEDWNSYPNGWSVSGGSVSQDCSAGIPGCGVHLNPWCCSSYTTVSRSLAVDLTGVTTVSFFFYGTVTFGDTDAGFHVTLSNGGRVDYEITDYVGGPNGNNGASVFSSGAEHRGFAGWPSANTWYQGVIILDPAANTAKAELRDASGTLLGTSDTLNIPASADRITQVDFHGVQWGGGDHAHGWDTIKVDVKTPVAPGAPTNPNAQGGVKQATVTWSAPTTGDAPTSYKVYRGTTPGGTKALIATVNAPTTAYTDTNLADNTTYYYQVSAVNAAGESPLSAEKSALTHAKPGAPSLNSASSGVRSATISWTPSVYDGRTPVTQYKVYRGTTAGGVKSHIATVNAPTTSYTDTNLADNTTYYYQVSAVNAVGESALSNEKSALTHAKPNAPTLTGATPGVRQVSLTWQAPTYNGRSPITWYKLYRGESSGGEIFVAWIPGSQTSYTDSGLQNNRTYFYQVSAVNDVSEGPRSNERSALTHAVPSAPKNLQAVAGPTSNDLTWSAPDYDGRTAITQYNVYRGTNSSVKNYLGSVSAPTTSYTDSNVQALTTYYYEVTAVNAAGESARSNEAVTTAGAPSAPRDLSCTTGENRVTLSWQAPANSGVAPVSGYDVFRNGAQIGTSATTSYLDTTAQNGNTYDYKVRARNAAGPGAFSNPVSCTPPPVPGAPQNLQAVVTGPREVTLTWQPPTENADAVDGYRVYRSEDFGAYEPISSPTGLTYTDHDVEKGHWYTYQVRAWNGYQESEPSNGRDVWIPLSPEAPVNLAVAEGNARLDVTWDAGPDNGGPAPQYYNLYRHDGNGKYALLGRTVGPETRYTDTAVVNGRTYCYKVSGVNEDGEGEQTPSGKCGIPHTVPGAPTNLQKTDGNRFVTLSWGAPVSDGGRAVEGYRIYRDSVLVRTAAAGDRSWTDTNVVNNQSYRYDVAAYNKAGNGANATVTANPHPEVPTAPQNLQGTRGDRVVHLTWQAPASDGGMPVTEYRVYRSTGNTCVGRAQIATVAGDRTSYSNGGLTNGQEYCYSVAAVNAVGESPHSNTVVAKPATLPGAPTGFTTENGNQQVTLRWSAPSSDGGETVDQYRVYRNGVLRTTLSGSTRSYTDTGLTNGVWYTYELSAVNEVGEGPKAGPLSAKPRTVPGAPTNLNAVPHSQRVDLTWSAPASNGGATIERYAIYRTNGGTTTRLETQDASTSYSDTGLVNGQEYCYTVRAINEAGEGPASGQDCAVANAVPSGPRNLQVSRSGSSATLSWQAPEHQGDGPIQGFCIYHGFVAGAELKDTCRPVSGFSYNAATGRYSFTLTGLTTGITYSYYVTAYNSFGESPASNRVSG